LAALGIGGIAHRGGGIIIAHRGSAA